MVWVVTGSGDFLEDMIMRENKPTEKLQHLLDFFSCSAYKANYAAAKSTSTCIMCGNPAKNFRNASTRLEYSISALCQNCQDEFFKNG